MILLDQPETPETPRFLFADNIDENEEVRIFVIHMRRPRFVMEFFINEEERNVTSALSDAIDPIPPEEAATLAREAGEFAMQQIEARTEG